VSETLEHDMTHVENYFSYVLGKEGENGISHIDGMRAVNLDFFNKRLVDFDNQHSLKYLLLGQVQSGKTAQLLSIIASIADTNDIFRTFVLLTTSNIALHKQTFYRCVQCLPTFEVCGENDEIRYQANANRRPALIVLKKNTLVLKRWKNFLRSSSMLEGRSIVIIDDEADATSLNTEINKGTQSKINGHLDDITRAASSSLYIQVTATPQALFMQTDGAGWKPTDYTYFEPGRGYLGGDFFFSDPAPYAYRQTETSELLKLMGRLRGRSGLPDGFVRAVCSYLLSSEQALSNGEEITSFLVHPSWSRDAHSRLLGRIEDALELLRTFNSDEEVMNIFKEEWHDLQASYPELKPLARLLESFSEREVAIHVLNSDNSAEISYANGANIVIGGNSLGRGLTFPMLLTVYYCRESKIPQMDTIWQHCRMFGYDRIPGLSRMFMPGDLYSLFSTTYASNKALIGAITSGKSEKLHIITDSRLRPTRRAVIDQSSYWQIVGGVNYFPNSPDLNSWSSIEVENAVLKHSKNNADLIVNVEEALDLLKRFQSESTGEWSTSAYIDAIRMWSEHRDSTGVCKLMIRFDRDVAFGTGSLLSPNDRQLTNLNMKEPTIVLYKLTGTIEKGWDGRPFWIPNVRMPDDYVFNYVSD
jgi:hypothetical protein